jgi:hypothetical protein
MTEMQAIQVKYLGPTNTKGSRYKATCQAGSLTLAANYSLNYETNCKAAAEALANKLGWHGKWFGGATEKDMVYVCAGLASHPDFMISRKPEAGWKSEEIEAYDQAMTEYLARPERRGVYSKGA